MKTTADPILRSGMFAAATPLVDAGASSNFFKFLLFPPRRSSLPGDLPAAFDPKLPGSGLSTFSAQLDGGLALAVWALSGFLVFHCGDVG